jgi:hypothetical protein
MALYCLAYPVPDLLHGVLFSQALLRKETEIPIAPYF